MFSIDRDVIFYEITDGARERGKIVQLLLSYHRSYYTRATWMKKKNHNRWEFFAVNCLWDGASRKRASFIKTLLHAVMRCVERIKNWLGNGNAALLFPALASWRAHAWRVDPYSYDVYLAGGHRAGLFYFLPIAPVVSIYPLYWDIHDGIGCGTVLKITRLFTCPKEILSPIMKRRRALKVATGRRAINSVRHLNRGECDWRLTRAVFAR